MAVLRGVGVTLTTNHMPTPTGPGQSPPDRQPVRRPLRTTVYAYDHAAGAGAKPVAAASTDENGAYMVELPAGSYDLWIKDPERPGRMLGPCPEGGQPYSQPVTLADDDDVRRDFTVRIDLQ